ncbi:uncharacterized protein BDW43DRAFT_317345 [Aspergillus alliaceus]|uniref:uncharacterized protein n=1 Tax=Petromyces alliaceus TaxID=209559 RepID=UPI0012A4E22A|nr:uncharacterized protein BDW43DRAFT_317345 [Aspergillus alliaceus]KAB8226893.1 hypothetical protein BDW43DRAFT_317345 [Aspergillus alliaceus]
MVATPLPDIDNPVEQGVRQMWAAMEGMVRKSQWTIQHTGQAIWIEAMQSKKGQTLYCPLLAYMDADSVAKHVQPWQQILVFIARTQVPRIEKSPLYGIISRQRKKWQQLWQTATIGSPTERKKRERDSRKNNPERKRRAGPGGVQLAESRELSADFVAGDQDCPVHDYPEGIVAGS